MFRPASFLSAVLSLYALSCAALSPALAQTVAIQNGNMEAATGDVPTGWDGKWEGRGKLRVSRDTYICRSGQASLKIEAVGGDAWGDAHQDLVNASPYATFTITGFVKTQGSTNALICVNTFQAGYKIIKTEIVGKVTGESDWKEFKQTVTLNSDATIAQVAFGIQGTGAAWLDDLTITAVKREPIKVVADSPAQYLSLAREYSKKGFENRASKDKDSELLFFEAALIAAQRSGDKATLANSSRDMGWVYDNRGRVSEARALQQKAVALCRVLRKPTAEALVWRDIGWLALGRDDYDTALPAFDTALLLAQNFGGIPEQENALCGIGDIQARRGEYRDAVLTYERALALNVQQRSISGQEYNLTHLADYSLKANNPVVAQAYFLRATNLYTKQEDRFRVICDNRKRCTDAGFFSESLVWSDKSIEIANRKSDLAQEQKLRKQKADTLYDNLFAYRSASQEYSHVLKIAQSLKDDTEATKAISHIGLCLYNLGETKEALRLLQDAEAKCKTKENRAVILHGMGQLFVESGDFSRALDVFNESLALYRLMNDYESQLLVMNSIGQAYTHNGMADNAVSLLKETKTANIAAQNNNYYLAEALIKLGKPDLGLVELQGCSDKYIGLPNLRGEAYLQLGDLSKAAYCFQQAIFDARKLGSRLLEAQGLNNSGILALRQDNISVAEKYLTTALTIYKYLGNKSGAAQVRANLGNVYEMRGQLPQALAQYQAAVALQEQVRGSFGAMTEAKTAFLESNVEPYRRMLRVYLKQKDTPAMFAAAQKMKARALLDLMNGGAGGGAAAQIAGRMTPDERTKEAALRAASEGANRRMMAEAVANETGSRARYDAEKLALAKAESDLQSFLNGLYARYPDLASQRGARTLTLADVAKSLPADTAVLEYLTLKVGLNPAHATDETLLFALTKDAAGKANCVLHRLPITRAELTERVGDLRAACADPNRSVTAKASALYQTLLAPVEAQLAGKKRVVVCPDGALWDLPFAALANARGETLLSRFELASAYSATGAITALSRPKPAPAPHDLLVVANPDFGDETRLGKPATETVLAGGDGARPISTPDRPISTPDRPIATPDRAIRESVAVRGIVRGGKIVALPGTQKEADSIQTGFGDRATVLTGTAAQETAFKQNAPGYRRLHIATHGFFNDAVPLQSALILAAPTGDDDGFLTARELLALNLSKTELVTLSACNTARGEQRSGEGVIGLTWALFAAGARSQIVSQWPVSDASTATLMSGFYERLATGTPKADALRQSALSLAKTPATAHPYYWAPFVLIGDWR